MSPTGVALRARAAGLVDTDASPFAVVVAVLATYLLMRVGFGLLAGLAQPVPDAAAGRAAQGQAHLPLQHLRHRGAHDDGQRRVPDPPRHCLEDMDLVTPVEDR